MSRVLLLPGIDPAPLLALLTALCFGLGLITSRVGLRRVDARTSAAISVPVALLMFALAAPFNLDLRDVTASAVLWFAALGLFFPACVTLLTNRSNELLGPTVTGAVSGTAPLFALLAAALLLGERIPARAGVATLLIACGVTLLTWRGGGAVRAGQAGLLWWPLAGAVVRGLSQVVAKAGLLLWPNPFAASLITYTVSSTVLVGSNRIGREKWPRVSWQGLAWSALTGVLNGTAVLLMYSALNIAPVSLVAPIVATYPLVTVLVSAVLLREERLTPRLLAGAGITVLAVMYLVSAPRGV